MTVALTGFSVSSLTAPHTSDLLPLTTALLFQAAFSAGVQVRWS